LVAVLIVVIGAALPGPSRAGPFSFIGRDIGSGAAEKLSPVLTATVADVDRRATRNEDHIAELATGLIRKGNVAAEERLDQVDRILEARLLQVKTEASDVVDDGLSRVDTLLENRLSQANVDAHDLVKQLGNETQDALASANVILRNRIRDLGTEIDGALDKADNALAARIDQLDEVAGRRLGNVDVIASKQRIGLERTAVRLTILIGLVVFVVFVLRRLWDLYDTILEEEAKELAKPESARKARARGAARTKMFMAELGWPLLGHLTVMVIAVGASVLLYDRLPFGAQKEAADLVALHEKALDTSLANFDFTRARFHASQLEYLEPKDASRYQALAAKAELLRDLFARPTLWASEKGIGEVSSKRETVQRLLGPAPDPDLLTVDAMMLWNTGLTRVQEHQAASLCARALRLRPQGFALSPLARVYVETFLRFPYIDAAAGLGRDAESLDDLEAVLDASAPDSPRNPLRVHVELIRLMGEVEAASSAAYVQMIRSHSQLMELQRKGDAPAQIASARQQRNAFAKQVLAAWKSFDDALVERPELQATPEVLAIFRLDDALYVQAKWFDDHPDVDEAAPLLVATPATTKASKGSTPAAAAEPTLPKGCVAALPSDPVERLKLAPPRVAWARRYRPLMDGPARKLVELQEAERFVENQRAAAELECALSPPPPTAADGLTAARAAARLGLYVGAESDRTPFARQLAPSASDKSLEVALRARTLLLL
jgi:hypothetical protein